MSLYGRNSLLEAVTDEDEDIQMTDEELDEYVDMVAYADMSRYSRNKLKSMNESGELQALQERQVLNKKTMMRLSRADDEKRRIKLIAYKLAKDDGNPSWGKMVKWRGLWRQERDKILKRYGKKAQKLSKIATKEYIARAKKEKVAPTKKK